MIVLVSTLIGVISGVTTARKRNGSAADMAQYGAGFGICFALIGLILTITIEKIVT